MDQRTSIMISAILFAAVVAGSISYLIYTRPADDQVAVISPTPTSTPEVTPEIVTENIPTITPEPTSVATPSDTTTVTADVSPSAPTGPVEMTLVATVSMTLLGAWGIRRLA